MRIRILLALSILGCSAAFAATPVRLVAPSSGASLRGDHFATFTWSSDRPIDAEEWEAFLSVDGGRYYSVRITPHLDLNLRSFEFLVPNIASDDVRLLMRVGDEHVETIYEFSQRFSIRPSPSVVVGRRLTAEPPPESARPGEPPVVQWATGGRAGDNVTVAHSRPRGAALRVRITEKHQTSTIALSRQETSAIELVADASAAVTFFSAPPASSPHIASRDVLRLITRLNV